MIKGIEIAHNQTRLSFQPPFPLHFNLPSARAQGHKASWPQSSTLSLLSRHPPPFPAWPFDLRFTSLQKGSLASQVLADTALLHTLSNNSVLTMQQVSPQHLDDGA